MPECEALAYYWSNLVYLENFESAEILFQSVKDLSLLTSSS